MTQTVDQSLNGHARSWRGLRGISLTVIAWRSAIPSVEHRRGDSDPKKCALGEIREHTILHISPAAITPLARRARTGPQQYGRPENVWKICGHP